MAITTSNRLGGVAPTVLVLLSALLACNQGDIGPQESVGNAQSFSIWAPSSNDNCSKEIHDSYSTLGPDHKLYPTWHPPVDPKTGCKFGHEHGRDPSGSNLYSEVGPIPFGYANEQLDTWDPNG